MPSTIRQSYIDLRGINLGAAFVHEHNLQPGQQYDMVIDGLPEVEARGTLDKSGFIGGLAVLYRNYDLQVEDELQISYDGAVIHITPPPERRHQEERGPAPAEETEDDTRPVFERQGLCHIYIEPYAPGNLSNWVPQTESDVYMVFGALSEYTDYRYCCGLSETLVARLGYKAPTRPDAILIERATGQYLVAEFKVNSRDFKSNHRREHVDVLVCWEDDEADRAVLPPRVLGLHALLETAIKEGEIDL